MCYELYYVFLVIYLFNFYKNLIVGNLVLDFRFLDLVLDLISCYFILFVYEDDFIDNKGFV